MAGKAIDAPHSWFRPIGNTKGTDLLDNEIRCKPQPMPLDVVSIPLKHHAPTGCQTENWRIDGTKIWEVTGRIGWNEAQQHIDTPQVLFHGTDYGSHASHDRIPKDFADTFESSLRLIHVPQVSI